MERPFLRLAKSAEEERHPHQLVKVFLVVDRCPLLAPRLTGAITPIDS